MRNGTISKSQPQTISYLPRNPLCQGSTIRLPRIAQNFRGHQKVPIKEVLWSADRPSRVRRFL